MSDDAPEAEPSEDWSEKVGKILEGAEALNTLKDGLELLGALEAAGEAGAAASQALLAAAIIGPILAMVASLYSILEADATEEKLAGARGFAYGVTWGVLDKGQPTAKCGGENELFPDRVQSEQEKWDSGAKEGVSKASDVGFKNRCIIWMAHNNDNGDQLLQHFFKDACSHLGLSDSTVGELASNLSVDSPVC